MRLNCTPFVRQYDILSASGVIDYVRRNIKYKDVVCIMKSKSGHTADSMRGEMPVMQNDMRRYQCSVCGYVYDPVHGEPKEEVSAGVPWSYVGSAFRCPVCGQGKAAFQAIRTEEYPGKASL